MEAVGYCVSTYVGHQSMVSDRVKSFCEVQGNEGDILIVLDKTYDLVKEINEGRCSGASWPKCKLDTE